jgi:peptidoglycan/LPS O-acetylase OafA/YrhL
MFMSSFASRPANEVISPPSDLHREPTLDTARGVACLLLVAYHAVGANDALGMRVADDSPYRLITDALAYVRMPLFTLLSGMVYAIRPVRADEVLDFLRGKIFRLLIPLICVGFLFVVTQRLVPGSNMRLDWHQMPSILLYPYAHFWFLQALFLVFLIVGALELAGLLSDRLRAGIALGVAALLFHASGLFTDVFAFKRALYLLPFFLAGVMIRRFTADRWKIVIEICLIFAVVSGAYGFVGDATHGLIKLLIPILAVSLLLSFVPPIGWLAVIGVYSYSIYLHHVFGTAGLRILGGYFGAGQLPIFVGATLAGILLPIAIHRCLAGVPVLSRAFLGVRRRAAEPQAS